MSKNELQAQQRLRLRWPRAMRRSALAAKVPGPWPNGQNGLESGIRHGDNADMRVTADERKRVVLPSAQPGDSFEVHMPAEGTVILTRVQLAPMAPAEVRMEKHGAFTVGVLNQPIDEEALKQALSEFP